MADRDPSELHNEAVLLAHLRRMVIAEILQSLPRDQAERAVSLAVQRLVQYLDEGPIPTIAKAASAEKFQETVDRVIEELQSDPSLL